jgi:hypothetical protein
MNSTTLHALADRIAVGLLLATATVTAACWLHALDAQRQERELMRTTFAQPTPQRDAAIAAGNASDLAEAAAVNVSGARVDSP